MIGAIAGDVIGSVYEFRPVKSVDIPLFGEGSTFTDDTVLTVATAEGLLEGGDYGASYRWWGNRYPDRSYGSLFRQWLRAVDPEPYGSYGNGAAMRVAPIGWAFGALEDVLREATQSARVTHDHPEGVRGARAAAGCVFLARTGASKEEIRNFVEGAVGYRLDRRLDEIRPVYRLHETCQGSVPEAITAFLESEGYEDAVRKAVSLGGDADTQAAIAGGIAEAFYGGVPVPILREVLGRLALDLGVAVGRFYRRFGGLRPAPGASGVPSRGRAGRSPRTARASG